MCAKRELKCIALESKNGVQSFDSCRELFQVLTLKFRYVSYGIDHQT